MNRVAIPWRTVLTFAIVLAAADWFWVIALRGAVGAIERTRSPFVSWVEGAGLLIPLFVFAVLGALTLAFGRFGPAPRSPRAVIAAGLLIAVACTLAGIGALGISGAYDYRLQIDQLHRMAGMRGTCIDGCLIAQQDAILALQLKAAGSGAVIVLITNLLLVGWMVATLGGRLTVSRTAPPEQQRADASEDPPGGRTGGGPAGSGWGTELQLVLVVAQIGMATVLAAEVAADLLDSLAVPLVLLLITAAQLGGAHLAGARPGRSTWVLAILLALVSTALSFDGQRSGTKIGLTASAITALGLTIIVVAGVLLAAPSWLRRPPASPHAGKLSLVAVVAVAAIGLGGSGFAAFDLAGLDVSTPTDHHLQ